MVFEFWQYTCCAPMSAIITMVALTICFIIDSFLVFNKTKATDIARQSHLFQNHSNLNHNRTDSWNTVCSFTKSHGCIKMRTNSSTDQRAGKDVKPLGKAASKIGRAPKPYFKGSF